MTSMTRSTGWWSNTVRISSAMTWSSTRPLTGSATSAGLKAFSSGSPKNSVNPESAVENGVRRYRATHQRAVIRVCRCSRRANDQLDAPVLVTAGLGVLRVVRHRLAQADRGDLGWVEALADEEVGNRGSAALGQ